MCFVFNTRFLVHSRPLINVCSKEREHGTKKKGGKKGAEGESKQRMEGGRKKKNLCFNSNNSGLLDCNHLILSPQKTNVLFFFLI